MGLKGEVLFCHPCRSYESYSRELTSRSGGSNYDSDMIHFTEVKVRVRGMYPTFYLLLSQYELMG